MKVVVIAHRDQARKPEEFAPFLDDQANQARALIAQDIVREIYSLADGNGAILVLEVKDEAEARALVEATPMAKEGLIRFDVYGTKPYRGLFQQNK